MPGKSTVHKSVLLKESIEGLNTQNGGVYVDATFGGGGHSLAILKGSPRAKVVALDQDKEAWDRSSDKFEGLESRIAFKFGNFRDLKDLVGNESVDGVLFDLGLSSDQLDNSGRGFTFMKDEPLMMTMKADPSPDDLTAKDIVNTWQEDSIEQVLRGYGEEKFAKRIARAICEAREDGEIESTFQLVDIIKGAVPAVYRRGKIHPATRTFQALRIAVNDELQTLERGLEAGFALLRPGGRMSVISFHSLEDRIVKNFYKKIAIEKLGKIINKKPIVPSREESKENPRARSAKLRIIEKI